MFDLPEGERLLLSMRPGAEMLHAASNGLHSLDGSIRQFKPL